MPQTRVFVTKLEPFHSIWLQSCHEERSMTQPGNASPLRPDLGHDDWQVPSVKELQSLVDYTRSPDTTHSPAIDPVFNCTTITNEGGQADYAFYWTGTTHAGLNGGSAAMYVAFGRAPGWMPVRGFAGGPPEKRGGFGPGPGEGYGPPPGSLPPRPESSAEGLGKYHFVDVHDPGAQRSDPKTFPHGRGPQGDVIRIYNDVRLVRTASTSNLTH